MTLAQHTTGRVRMSSLEIVRAHLMSYFLFAIALCSCGSELRVLVPDVESLNVLENTKAIPRSALRAVDGVYLVKSGTNRFGDTLVLKHDGPTLSIFCQRNSAYLILRSGMRDTTFLYAGYWRFAQGPQSGLAVLQIDSSDVIQLLRGRRPADLQLRGNVGSSENFREEQIVLRYLRPLYGTDTVRTSKPLLIIAHRGGGRNSDRLPFSENSAELVRFASKLGAHGVEIDVRLTRDSVPVLYHDENLNTRLVDGEFMVGPIGNYSLAQLRALCRLKNGELIPTLEKVLDDIIDSTNLRAVWLDIKEVGEIEKVIALQQRASERARLLYHAGLRDSLEIYFGLASEDIYQAFVSRPDHAAISSVCELSTEKTLAAGSKVYGARWTLGSLITEVQQLHAQNTNAFVWTLDQPDFILRFLHDADYDGILTNYPTVVAYHYYVQP